MSDHSAPRCTRLKWAQVEVGEDPGQFGFAKSGLWHVGLAIAVNHPAEQAVALIDHVERQ